MFALWGGVLILAQGPSVEMTLVSITSPVQIGELATLVIHTVAGAYCGIDNRQQLGPSKSPGLRPQRADEQGQIHWDLASRRDPDTARPVGDPHYVCCR